MTLSYDRAKAALHDASRMTPPGRCLPATRLAHMSGRNALNWEFLGTKTAMECT
jgi:hypothetical protein